jgi:hypothetical protein
MRWLCMHPGDSDYEEHERLEKILEEATTAQGFEAAFNDLQAFCRAREQRILAAEAESVV